MNESVTAAATKKKEKYERRETEHDEKKEETLTTAHGVEKKAPNDKKTMTIRTMVVQQEDDGVDSNSTPERHNKRQKLLQSQSSSLMSSSSPSSSVVGELSSSSPSISSSSRIIKRVVSSSIIADFILPFIPSRTSWNALSIVDQELYQSSKKLTPPWPHRKTINLRGTPWPVSIALSSPIHAEWMACGTEEGGMIRLWNSHTGRCTILSHPPQQYVLEQQLQQQQQQQQPQQQQQQPLFQNPGSVVHVEFSPKDSPSVQMISCCEDGTVRIWDLSHQNHHHQRQQGDDDDDDVSPTEPNTSSALDDTLPDRDDSNHHHQQQQQQQQQQQLVQQEQELPTQPFPSRLFGNFAKIHRIGGGHTRATFSPSNGRHLACATWRTKTIDPDTGRFCVLSIWNVNDGVCLKRWGAGAEQWNGAGLVHNFGFYSVLFHPNYNDEHDDAYDDDDENDTDNIEEDQDNKDDARHRQYLVTQYCDKRNTAQVWDLTKRVPIPPPTQNNNNNHSYGDCTVPLMNLISTGGGRCRHLQPLRVNLPPAVFVRQDRVDRPVAASLTATITAADAPDLNSNMNRSTSSYSSWLLALGGTQKIGLWSIPEGIQERQASHDVYRIMAMAVSPDGNILATSNAVGDASLWSTQDGRLLRALSEPSNNLHTMAFTDNGRTLVCVGMTGTIQMCDASV